MAVSLEAARIRSAVPRLRDFGGVVGEAVEQRLNRPGNRYAIDIEVPPMHYEPEGRNLAALLRSALTQGAEYPWPQPGLKIGSPGVPLVDGAVSAGSVLPIKGLTPYYPIRFGQFFSIIHSGQRYLHSAAEAVMADASGDAEVTLAEMLRTPLSNNDVIEIAKPMIEGLIEGGDLSHQINLGPFAMISFSISEQA